MKKLKIEEVLIIIILGIMALVDFVNVLSRYIFHFSFAATEEITVNLFVWLTVLGIAVAFERGSHLGMNTLFDKFPKSLKAGYNYFGYPCNIHLCNGRLLCNKRCY